MTPDDFRKSGIHASSMPITPRMPQFNRRLHLKTSALILGAFCIAYNLSHALHELGHCVAVWFSGGRVNSVVLNPFSWSWTTLGSDPNPLFTSWGGVLLGVPLAIIPSIVARYFRSPYLTPLYLLGCSALGINGIYLSIAAFADDGDAGALMAQGVPRGLIVGIGLCMLGVAAVWMSFIQSMIGIHSSIPLHRRLIVLHFGITTYLIAMVVYVILFDRSAAPLFIGFAAAGFLTVSGFGVIGHKLRKVSIGPFHQTYVEPTRASAGVVLLLGVAVVGWELLYFAPYYN